ncbi:hypothetical protein ACLOJK_027240, partial [Asimina triloba]
TPFHMGRWSTEIRCSTICLRRSHDSPNQWRQVHITAHQQASSDRAASRRNQSSTDPSFQAMADHPTIGGGEILKQRSSPPAATQIHRPKTPADAPAEPISQRPTQSTVSDAPNFRSKNPSSPSDASSNNQLHLRPKSCPSHAQSTHHQRLQQIGQISSGRQPRSSRIGGHPPGSDNTNSKP